LIVVGGNRPAALLRVARYGDGWHPMNVAPDGVRRRMEALGQQTRELGREHVPQAVQVRLDMSRLDAETIAAYEGEGVTDLIVHVPSSSVEKQRAAMQAFARFLG